MDTKSKHLLIELFDCHKTTLQDQTKIETLLIQAAKAANVTIVQSVFHKYFPQGVTGVVIIEESHLSIHTWPEYGYASVDFYTCGKGIPEKALDIIQSGLIAGRTEVICVDRGQSLTDTAMSLRYHRHAMKN
ncbi:S-adenosylmethionine decarboxylase proenzyme [Candidatus Endobugula sertula]|uniref:S-adenosylmethionine decarboxylase proenzyme n=1 Tax=Candidatus Endobugula sertula TaxID=62101 RepID=A0A1D2QRK8_9GAMM|nr:S-adenosylmethionine decarboxylase proenzyme [Candidatus Endobugula sertula]